MLLLENKNALWGNLAPASPKSQSLSSHLSQLVARERCSNVVRIWRGHNSYNLLARPLIATNRRS